MNAKELREYDTQKIKSMIIQLKSSIMEYRFKMSQGETVSTGDIRKSRRVIAQLMTILAERKERLTSADWKGFGEAMKKKDKNK